jgi:hypothetical protein
MFCGEIQLPLMVDGKFNRLQKIKNKTQIQDSTNCHIEFEGMFEYIRSLKML